MAEHFGHLHFGDIDEQVEPVEKRSGKPMRVTVHGRRKARAGMIRLAVIAAGARVTRADEHELSREPETARGTGNTDETVLKWLAKVLKTRPTELRHLIEKKNPPMG
jgi:hypothetical protein